MAEQGRMQVAGVHMDFGEAGAAVGLGAAALGVLGGLGKGIAWLLNYQGERTLQRQKALLDWEAALQRRGDEYRETIEAELRDMRKDQRRDAARIHVLSTQVNALQNCCSDMTQALRAIDPSSPALLRTEAYLRAAFSRVDLTVPPDMAVLLGQIDNAGGDCGEAG